jgi:hypothetical protein
MGLLEKLQALGCQLKLVQMIPKTTTTPEKIDTRSVTLEELTTELQAENIRILAESPVELTIAFEKIFATAGIVLQSNGWTIERVNELLHTPPFHEMESGCLQKALIQRLADEKVSTEDMVKEALSKDQALDAFETFIEKKAKERSAARRMHLVEIEKQIGMLEQEKKRLLQDDRNEPDRLLEWKQKKKTYENEILSIVNLLINTNGHILGKGFSVQDKAE